MVAHSFRVLARISLFFLLTTLPVGGQAVVGRVTGTPDTEPIAGAVVFLLDATGEAVRGVLTNENGRFILPAPGPGSYRVRAEMIGRRTAESEAFDVGIGPVIVDLAMVSVPIQLDELQIKAASRCETGPDVGLAALTVWDEIKKALRAETVARDLGYYEFGIKSARRTYDPNTSQLVRKDEQEGKSLAITPFRTLPPAEIAQNGYAKEVGDETMIYGPNAAVFLSPEFQDTHCFSLKKDDDRVGLVFKPLSDRRVTDIEGVIWVDRETAELQRVEFKYKRIPYGLLRGNYSGFAEFQRLEGGAWIISRWRLTTPASIAEAEVTSLERVADASQIEELEAQPIVSTDDKVEENLPAR